MNEFEKLINNYLVPNPQINNCGFYTLTPFDMSDFHKKKGLKGKEEEAHLNRLIENSEPDGCFHFIKPEYTNTLKNWNDNFNRSYISHYEKISTYKSRVFEHLQTNGKDILVGFFIENLYPPILQHNHLIDEIPYYFTKQFIETFINSPNLDFVLFGGYLSGRPQITYLDKTSINKLFDASIDLNDTNVKLSHINQNETIAYIHK